MGRLPSTTNTVEVGGTSFPSTKPIVVIPDDDDCDATTMRGTTETNDTGGGGGRTIHLVARGKSHLSYFYVGVCSSVLYLPRGIDNDLVMRFANDDDVDDDANTAIAMALDIHYHKPARASDLIWATTKFVESNLPGGTKMTDLSDEVRRGMTEFNDLYRNASNGDRYSLIYMPELGLRLCLNDEILGTIGTDMSNMERRVLARIVYSVWFGRVSPFSVSMRDELLTPLLDDVRMMTTYDENDTTRVVSTGTGSRAINDTTAVALRENAILATSGRDITSKEEEEEDGSYEEEMTLLESMGIIGDGVMIDDEGSGTAPPRTMHRSTSDADRSSGGVTRVAIDRSEECASTNDTTYPSWTNFHRYLPRRGGMFLATNKPDDAVIDAHAPQHGKGSTMTSVSRSIDGDESGDDANRGSGAYNPVILGIGAALFLFPHLAVLLSLPPVLMRRGAPYLPTFGNRLDVMFDMVRRHRRAYPPATGSSRFVDLGSGDGRVVFRAAREGMFDKSVGYEINPALHIFASLRRSVTPRYWQSTSFYMSDLWRVTLKEYDVVAVYGLSPIMGRLGNKMERELRPGSIVVSNVFEIPGWKASDVGGVKGSSVFLYSVPECFRGGRSESQTTKFE